VTLFPSQENISTDSISLGWIVLDSHSGYSYAQIWLDTETNVIYNGSSLNYLIQSLSEGEHKVNVTVYDKAMNKKSVEYEFFVDLTNPIVTIINPTITTLDERSIMLEWSVVDTGSGYQKAEVRIDDDLIGTVNSLSTSLIVEDMNWGIHTLNLRVFDWVNRTDSVEFQIILQQPLLDILPQMVIIGGVGIVIILIVYYKKR